MPKGGDASKKNKKVGRQRKSSQNLRYINERRHERSHRRKITKHLRKHTGDNVARKALDEVEIKLGIFHKRSAG